MCQHTDHEQQEPTANRFETDGVSGPRHVLIDPPDRIAESRSLDGDLESVLDQLGIRSTIPRYSAATVRDLTVDRLLNIQHARKT